MSDDKLNIDEIDFFDDQEEVYEVVTLVNDDGSQQDFFVMDGIDVDNTRYLLLVKTEEFDLDEPEAFIFKEVAVSEDECTYEPVEDDGEYNKVMLLLQNEDAGYEFKL